MVKISKLDAVRLYEAIKESALSAYKVEELLKLDNEIIKKLISLRKDLFREGALLATMSLPKDTILRKLDILSISNTVSSFAALLILENNFSYDDAITYIKILNEAPSKENVKLAYSAITNVVLKSANIEKEAAKKLCRANNNIKLQNMYNVLVNKDTVNAGIALSGAEIINRVENDKTGNIIVKILTNNALINENIALSSAELISTVRDYYRCERIFDVLVNEKNLQNKVSYRGAEILSQIKDEATFNLAYMILKNNLLVDLGLALDLVIILSKNDIANIEKIKIILGSERVKKIVTNELSKISIYIATSEEAKKLYALVDKLNISLIKNPEDIDRNLSIDFAIIEDMQVFYAIASSDKDDIIIENYIDISNGIVRKKERK